jgi:hypothetical protein
MGAKATTRGEREMELAHNGQTRRTRRGISTIAAVMIAGLAAFAVYEGLASPKASAEAELEPAIVTAIGNTGLSRIELSPSAIKRLDLQTAAVRSVGNQRTVPYSAVLYDPDGTTWVYKTTKPRTFVRSRITVDHVQANRAFLSLAPAAGTRVATVGAQELFGAEHGVGATSGH